MHIASSVRFFRVTFDLEYMYLRLMGPGHTQLGLKVKVIGQGQVYMWLVGWTASEGSSSFYLHTSQTSLPDHIIEGLLEPAVV